MSCANRKSPYISHTIPTTFSRLSNSLTSTNPKWSYLNYKKDLLILRLSLLNINSFIKNRFNVFLLILIWLLTSLYKWPISTREFTLRILRRKSTHLITSWWKLEITWKLMRTKRITKSPFLPNSLPMKRIPMIYQISSKRTSKGSRLERVLWHSSPKWPTASSQRLCIKDRKMKRLNLLS